MKFFEKRTGSVGRTAWIWLASLLVVGGMSDVEAQRTRADTAQVLLEAARDLQDAGYLGDAEELLRVVVRRYAETAAAGAARELLDTARRQGRPGAGRAAFVGWHTALGATLGVLVPAAFDAREPEAYGAGLLIGGPLGYIASRAYTTRHPLTTGQALMIDYASLWGMSTFPIWRDVLDIGQRTDCFVVSGSVECFEIGGDDGPEAAIWGAVAGVAGGILLAGNRNVSTSTAFGTMFASHWGLAAGFLGAVYTDQLDDDPLGTWMLTGGNLGFAAGLFGMPKLDWSASRTWLVHMSGVAGITAAGGLVLLFDLEDDQAIASVMAAGGVLGLAAGTATTSLMDQRNTLQSQAFGVSGSLLDRRDGEWKIGVPMPRSTLLPSGAGASRPFVRGWKFNVLTAEF